MWAVLLSSALSFLPFWASDCPWAWAKYISQISRHRFYTHRCLTWWVLAGAGAHLQTELRKVSICTTANSKRPRIFFFSRRKQNFSGTIGYGRCYSQNYFVALMFELCVDFAWFEFWIPECFFNLPKYGQMKYVYGKLRNISLILLHCNRMFYVRNSFSYLKMGWVFTFDFINSVLGSKGVKDLKM